MKIIKAIVILQEGSTDRVILTTDLPSPIIFDANHSSLTLSFDCTINTGVDYVKKHFNLEPEIVT